MENTTVIAPRKVLAIAFACNPYYGSERGVGWGYVSLLAQFTRVHVITSAGNKADIERFLAANPAHPACKAAFKYLPFDVSRARRLQCVLPFYFVWRYRGWLKQAYNLAEAWHGFERFAITHLLTYGTFRFPGHFYRLDSQFVWGPVGALENTPWHLLRAAGLKGALQLGLRNVLNSLQKDFSLAPRRAFARAAGCHGVIAATTAIQREIKCRYHVDSAVLSEIGLPLAAKSETIAMRSPDALLRLVWSGNLIAGKALPLLLKALARLPRDMDVQLDVLGDGRSKAAWRKLAQKLGVNARISWHGWLSRDEALKVMRQGHVFVQTSLKDLTSTVIVEALFCGMPVITLDHCGFSDVINASCGLKVKPGKIADIVADFAAGIEKLYNDEAMRQGLAQGALERANAYTWEAKQRHLRAIYEGVK